MESESKGKVKKGHQYERRALYTAPKGANPKKKVNKNGKKHGKSTKYSRREVMDLFSVFSSMDKDGTGDVDILEFKRSLRVGTRLVVVSSLSSRLETKLSATYICSPPLFATR